MTGWRRFFFVWGPIRPMGPNRFVRDERLRTWVWLVYAMALAAALAAGWRNR